MFGLNKTLTSVSPLITRRLAQRSLSTNIATPARNRVSKGEQFVLGAFLVGCMSFTPIWVMVHMKEYRGDAE